MDANEEYVRSRWEFVVVHEHNGSFSVLYGSPINPRGGNVGSTEISTVWKWVADFTRARERQIAEVEERLVGLQR